MAEEPELPSAPRRKVRIIHVLWGLGLGLLLLLAGFLEYVYKPWHEVRDVLEQYGREEGYTPEDSRPSPSRLKEVINEQQVIRRLVVQKLGGPRAAERKLTLYARLPARWTPRQSYAVGLSDECEDPVRMQIALLRGSDGQTRYESAQRLRTSGDSRAVGPLIVVLNDSDASVACAAAVTLGELRDPRALEPLKTCLGDSRQGVREAAQRALGRIEAR